MKNIEDSYPLSPMQQGMIFHSLYSPHSGYYISQVFGDLYEELNASVFRQAWQQILERHPVLRSSLDLQEPDKPLQEIHRSATLSFLEDDWSGLSKKDRKNRMESFFQADRQREFELNEAPLMRVAVFKQADACYRFIWTFHHVLLDGYSVNSVLNEVFAYYEAYRLGKNLTLPSGTPYRDYIEWLAASDPSQAEAFWRQSLKGFTEPVSLPMICMAHPSYSQQAIYGAQELRLSESTTSALKSLALDQKLTVNTIVQGTWALLMSRYNGQEDIVFGSVREGRRFTVAGAESIVGPLLNTVPVRISVLPGMALIPWLQEIRKNEIAMREHRLAPLNKIKEWSEVPTGMNLFETTLNYMSRPWNHFKTRGEQWQARKFQVRNLANYLLAVNIYELSELDIRIEYDQCRINNQMVSQILGHFRTLLERIAQNPEQRLAELSMLSDRERRLVLYEWNATAKDFPKGKCIHQFFEEQAERTPNAVAAVFEDSQLTFRELNEKANRLANYLRKKSINLVGICLERSLEMVISVLGVLKAGGAYVPLDFTHPKERLAYMISDTKLKVILTRSSLLKNLPGCNISFTCLDNDWEQVALESKRNPGVDIQPDHLAYILYTSGSTGKPKGVLIEHRQVINYVMGIMQHYQLQPGATYAMLQPLTVDSSVTTIYPPLFSGGCLHLISEERALDGEALAEYFDRFAIDCLKIAPSHLAALQAVYN